MLKIENWTVHGLDAAVHGMRNPMNSWERSDSHFAVVDGMDCRKKFVVGEKDRDLMMKLAKGGPVHAKYRRMVQVWVDITAPLYFWKEFDTYKVGTVANSCSTMHTIHKRPLVLEDFSHEHLGKRGMAHLLRTINEINYHREMYLEQNDKLSWWQMIQLLPSSFNQKRTVMMSYEVLTNIYRWRKDHRLDEWHTLCDWIRGLPCAEIIMMEEEDT